MSRKSAKMAVTYIVTILLTLVVVGGVIWYMAEYMLFTDKKDPTSGVHLEQMVSTADYTPTDADNRTLLLILDAEKRQSAACFVVTRFLAEEKQVIFLALPTTTKCPSGDSLYDVYRNGGTTAAVSAAESLLGLDIDKYIKFNSDSFGTIVSIFGGVDYDVPYNLIYDNPSTGEETIIREGRTYLDSTTMRKVLTYPNYKAGEEYRARCTGLILSEMLNDGVNSKFPANMDDYFSGVINSDIETDITKYDYDEVSAAMKYVAAESDRISMFVTASGADDENGLYELDKNFVKSLTEWLKLYDETVPSETSSPKGILD